MMKVYWVVVLILIVLIVGFWVKHNERQKVALLMASTRDLSASDIAEGIEYICDHLNDKSSKEIYMRIKTKASTYAKVSMPAVFEEFKASVKNDNDMCENPRSYFHVKENSY